MPRPHVLLFAMLLTFALAGALLLHPADEDPALLLTGFAEVQVVRAVDAAEPEVARVAVGRLEGVDEPLRGRFGTTDECKPLGDGRWLVASSGGAVAVLEEDGSRASFSAAVPNAHSIELLPGGRVVSAASVNARGNRLMVHDLETGELVQQFAMRSAHGVHYRARAHRLYALGMAFLCEYRVDPESGELSLAARHALPEGEEADGHDLSFVPGSDDLIVTTHEHVWLFDPGEATFRLHPLLGELTRVKSVDVHPRTGRIAYVQASAEHWWSEVVHLERPKGELRIEGERFYKARWSTRSDP